MLKEIKSNELTWVVFSLSVSSKWLKIVFWKQTGNQKSELIQWNGHVLKLIHIFFFVKYPGIDYYKWFSKQHQMNLLGAPASENLNSRSPHALSSVFLPGKPLCLVVQCLFLSITEQRPNERSLRNDAAWLATWSSMSWDFISPPEAGSSLASSVILLRLGFWETQV